MENSRTSSLPAAAGGVEPHSRLQRRTIGHATTEKSSPSIAGRTSRCTEVNSCVDQSTRYRFPEARRARKASIDWTLNAGIT